MGVVHVHGKLAAGDNAQAAVAGTGNAFDSLPATIVMASVMAHL